jgi:hypothetical protein
MGWQVHNAGVKPYACPVCGCRFHLLHNMKRHIHTHEDQGDIEAGTAEGLIQARGPRNCFIFFIFLFLFFFDTV